MRCAIGAGRERLVRQMLTESVVLAGFGGLAGLGLAMAAAPLIARLVPPNLPIAETPPLDARVLAIALFTTLVTGVGFGLVPALRLSRTRADALREGARAGTSRPTERLRSMLVVAQVTATVVLLMTSGLLLRALWRVQSTDPGFRVEDVQTFRTALPFPRYMQTMRRAAFYRRVLGEVRQLPGVTQASYISFLPMTMRGGIWAVVPEGATANETTGPTASLRYVTPGFFDTMQIPLRLGRDISEGDDDKAPHVAVVSESFVRRHWPGLDPIGRRFFFAFETRTVVGVVGDVRVRGLERTSEPQVYLSYQQVPDGWLAFFTPKDLVVRSRLTPEALVPEVRRIIAAADPEQPISEVQPLADIVTADTASRRVQARVLVGFALMAFLLAGIGVHGLLAFTVSARARELSVRMALGARPSDIVISVVKRALLLSAAGVAAGVVTGLSAGRTLQAILAGIEPADPQTIGAVVAACGVVTVLGSAMPAFRAGRTNPIEAMKTE